MAFTEEEKRELVQAVLQEIEDASHVIEDVETVSSLTGIKSMPVVKGDRLVNVLLEVFEKPGKDAAAAANAAAQKAEAAMSGMAETTTAANKAAETANAAAAKAEAAAGVVNRTFTATMEGATVRFSGIVESGNISPGKSTTPGGKIVWVRSADRFAYQTTAGLYAVWEVEGVPPSELFHSDGIPHPDKLYLLGDTLYVCRDGSLSVLVHRHEVMSEDDFEALANKDENVIYMTYEEE